jgi:hypothetical protein
MKMYVEGASQEEESSHYHLVHRMPLPHESLQPRQSVNISSLELINLALLL